MPIVAAAMSPSYTRTREIVTTLASRGVLVDYREPDVVRVGCSPLTTRFVDVFDGLQCIAELT